MNLSKLWEIMKDREAGPLQPLGSQRVGHDSVTEHRNKNANLEAQSKESYTGY